MDDRFDQEFYRSQWQRVLPVGPHGIQPYIRTGRSSRLSSASPARRRLLATLAGLARSVLAFRRWAGDRHGQRPATAGNRGSRGTTTITVRGAPELVAPRMREAGRFSRAA